MNKDEIKRLLATDFNFAVNFLLKNNYPGVVAALSGLGYNVTSPEQAYNVIKGFQSSGNIEAIRVVFATPYLNDVQNETGGLRDSVAVSGAKIDFSFIPFVGDLVNGLVYGGEGSQSGASSDIATILLAQQQADAARRAATTQTVLLVLGGLVVLAIVGGIIYAATRPKKSKE